MQVRDGLAELSASAHMSAPTLVCGILNASKTPVHRGRSRVNDGQRSRGDQRHFFDLETSCRYLFFDFCSSILLYIPLAALSAVHSLLRYVLY